MNAVKTPKQLSSAEIAGILDGQLIGDAQIIISGVEVIERVTADQLSYVGDARNLSRIRNSSGRLILVPTSVRESLIKYSGKSFIVVPDAESAFLQITALLHPLRTRVTTGISDLASVDPSATVGANTSIHPFAVVGRDVVIGENCEIQSGVAIGDGCRIGDNVLLCANTVLYHDITIESDVIIHASCVIGADGFGYRFRNGGHERIPHHGTVRICRDVEIGASTTIDRAKVGETVIGSGTRIDNQVMIGHNCHVGRHNLLVSQVGLAGSVTTGDYVVCAGQSGIADHVHIGDRSVVGAKAGVHRDIPEGQTYLGNPAGPAGETSRQLMALRRLPEIREKVKQMEKDLESLRARLSSTEDQEMPSAAA